MKSRNALLAGAALALATLMGVSAANATVIDFNLPSGQADLGASYSQDGFTFTNSAGGDWAYFNWVAYGAPSNNADDSGDISQDYMGTSNTITQDNGNPFSFQSIDLAGVYNNLTGGDVLFTFNYAGGGSSSQTVTLASGVSGLQTFSFNQTNLASVVFTPQTTEWIQFDNVGVNGGVPEPASWAMMLLGFLGLGAAMRAHRRADLKLDALRA